MAEQIVYSSCAGKRRLDAVMIVYGILGIIFGIVGGMGLGGGIVLIPALTIVMSASQHEAQGMTLFAFIPMAAAALFLHFKNKQIKIKEVIGIAIIGSVFSVLGYLIAKVIDADTLRTAFAVFLILVAVLRIYKQEIMPRMRKK